MFRTFKLDSQGARLYMHSGEMSVCHTPKLRLLPDQVKQRKV